MPLCLDLPPPSLNAQRALWGHALQAAGAEVGDDGFDGLAGFELSPAQVARTAEQAAQRASHAGRDLTEADLREAARHHNGSAISTLARRVVPSARWDDLIVTAPVHDQLRELLNRVKFAPQVLERWTCVPAPGGGRASKPSSAGHRARARPSPPRSSPARSASSCS